MGNVTRTTLSLLLGMWPMLTRACAFAILTCLSLTLVKTAF